MRRLQQQNIYMIFLFCTKHHNTTTQKPHDTNLIIAILFLSLSLCRSLSLSLSRSRSLSLSLSLRLFCTVFKLSNLSFAYLHPFSHFISFCLFIQTGKRKEKSPPVFTQGKGLFQGQTLLLYFRLGKVFLIGPSGEVRHNPRPTGLLGVALYFPEGPKRKTLPYIPTNLGLSAKIGRWEWDWTPTLSLHPIHKSTQVIYHSTLAASTQACQLIN